MLAMMTVRDLPAAATRDLGRRCSTIMCSNPATTPPAHIPEQPRAACWRRSTPNARASCAPACCSGSIAEVENMRTERADPPRSSSPAAAPRAGWRPPRSRSTLGKVLDITLVESDEIGTVGVGEATIPTLSPSIACSTSTSRNSWPRRRPRSSSASPSRTGATAGERYIHSFGTTGKDHWTAGFQHFWLQGARAQAGRRLRRLLPRAAASLRQVRAPAARRHELCVPHRCEPVCEFLRKLAEGFGAKRIEGKIVEVQVRREVRLHHRR